MRTAFSLVQAQTSRAPLFNQNSSDKMSRSARSSLSLSLSPTPTSHRHPFPTNSVAPSRRHRRKMQPPDCISRYDRIISGKRRLKRLPAARLHRKTGVIPDYNVTAVSRRFTIRFDRQPDCYDHRSPRCPPLSSPWRRLYKKLSGITDWHRPVKRERIARHQMLNAERDNGDVTARDAEMKFHHLYLRGQGSFTCVSEKIAAVLISAI